MDDDGSARSGRRALRRALRQLSLPLASWAALATIAVAAPALAAVAVVLFAAPHQPAGVAIAAGTVVALVGVAVVAASAQRLAQAVDRLAADASRRSTRPAGAADLSVPVQVRELRELGGMLDALDLRAIVAEETAEQALRTAHTAGAGMFELLSGLVAAEEAARGQLSADLHDTVAQTLVAARTILANPEGQQGAWERVRDLVDEAEEELRAAMARARPPELRDADLASAVDGLRRDMAARYLLDVELSWPEDPRPVPMVTAVAIYRFFQEALLNVVKHADVDEVSASLTVTDDALVAVVRDAGPGFEPDKVQSSGGRHIGLGLLRERARLAGGGLDIATAPERGTTLTLRLPLAPYPTTAEAPAPSSTPAPDASSTPPAAPAGPAPGPLPALCRPDAAGSGPDGAALR